MVLSWTWCRSCNGPSRGLEILAKEFPNKTEELNVRYLDCNRATRANCSRMSVMGATELSVSRYVVVSNRARGGVVDNLATDITKQSGDLGE